MRFNLRTIVCSIVFSLGALTTVTASASTFNIVVHFEGGLTTSQQAIFGDAETFWENAITGYQSTAAHGPLMINAAGTFIDGLGGILAYAGPRFGQIADGFTTAIQGTMTFDSGDLEALETSGTLLDVILHEMAHVIGFGTLWNTDSIGGAFAGTQSVYVDDTGQYTGANALAAYQAEFDPTATFVPVELDGGRGTANGHWDETWAGGTQELLTGYLDAPTFISDTTIASFADIGYTVDLTANDFVTPVPLPSSLFLGFSALGLMGWVGRRRSQPA